MGAGDGRPRRWPGGRRAGGHKCWRAALAGWGGRGLGRAGGRARAGAVQAGGDDVMGDGWRRLLSRRAGGRAGEARQAGRWRWAGQGDEPRCD